MHLIMWCSMYGLTIATFICAKTVQLAHTQVIGWKMYSVSFTAANYNNLSSIIFWFRRKPWEYNYRSEWNHYLTVVWIEFKYWAVLRISLRFWWFLGQSMTRQQIDNWFPFNGDIIWSMNNKIQLIFNTCT